MRFLHPQAKSVGYLKTAVGSIGWSPKRRQPIVASILGTILALQTDRKASAGGTNLHAFKKL